jgi:uncharacterized protein
MARNAPPAFHVLAKPRGALCNLACQYCFYLEKKSLYEDGSFRMSDDVLDSYLRQVIQGHSVPDITIAWQGGEPLLMDLDFFRRSIELEKKYAKPGVKILNTIQTNGTLLNDEWCEFFRTNGFLVGISIDGPRELHDAFRQDVHGGPTFDRVMKGLNLLQQHKVEHNALTTINSANADQPMKVYQFLRDEAKFQFIQLIPVVERARDTLGKRTSKVTKATVRPGQYGRFMIGVFDEWVKRDVGEVFVQTFDAALANWYGEPAPVCVSSPFCGTALALEHNGDLYSCDHFVDPEHLLGNIMEEGMVELISSDRQRQFGMEKARLPRYCMECDVRFACHGGCPKDRFSRTPAGQEGLNYLCPGLKSFYHHIDRPMRIMCELLRQGRAPAEIVKLQKAKFPIVR